MLKFIQNGNLFVDESTFIVNACNKVGVMGGGIARVFKEKYPEVFLEYHALCKKNLCDKFFDVFVADSGRMIVCFYTKNHWMDDSNLQNIDDGLHALKRCLQGLQVVEDEVKEKISIAFPALGCGLGGLNWDDVKKLFEKHFSDVSFDVTVYEPLETK